jgi:hypothetical protein
MLTCLIALGFASWLFAAEGAAAPKAAPKAEAPKASEDADDGIQGLYVGTLGGAKAEARVIGLKDKTYKVILTSGAGAGAVKVELSGKLDGGKVALSGAAGEMATVADKKLTGETKGGKFELAYTVPKSPTEGAKPPAGAIVLLPYEEGKPTTFAEWTNDTWVANPDGSMQKGKGDNMTKKPLGSVQLHLEFRCPYMPGATGQGRANSGVYMMDRYEIQVLDSFGLAPQKNDCGSIYTQIAPKVNACFPPLVWQTYDITWHAPKLGADGKKVKNVTVTVVLNGVAVHDNIEVAGPTGSSKNKPEVAEAPMRLQDHGNAVRFRNIWVKPLAE